MRILWVCNIMLPVAAQHLHKEPSYKEGWVSGLCGAILERREENGIVLGVAFPVEKELDGWQEEITVPVMAGTQNGQEKAAARLMCYGFYEDVDHAERYDDSLESRMRQIAGDFRPDVIHCFGTEYAHTLAMTRVCPHKDRLLVGIQGLCAVYANTYMANLPDKVRRSVTFRDWVKQDSLMQQQEKFAQRGRMEKEAIGLAGNITGRTDWDRHYAAEWNPQAVYFVMNETLRPNFYDGRWQEDRCEPYRIFLSQGDYPIKGLHYMLLALPAVRDKFPAVKVCVAGNSLVRDRTWKDKVKLSAYGKYLRNIIRENHLEKYVEFLGRLNAEEMKEQYLRSGLFVCCSTIENSPNSLGEAMLLGLPCVSADVGGIPSLFRHKEDGLLYRGYRTKNNSYDNACDDNLSEEQKLKNIVSELEKSIIEMWNNKEDKLNYACNARKHAEKTHNKEDNYHKMIEIYSRIVQNNSGEQGR